MRKKTALQAKTPFAIAPAPMEGLITPYAGLAAVSRALRALGLPESCDTELQIKQRQRGYTPGQQVEALILLHAAGWDCMDDMEMLRKDAGLSKMLGYDAPSPRAVGDFLAAFHDEDKIGAAIEQAKAQARLAFIPEQSAPLEGLQNVQRRAVSAIAQNQSAPTHATIDQDATIIESHKRNALWTYEGMPGYQPMVAAWAETGLIVADEFRDGNVPAMMAPLVCAKAAFAALPSNVSSYAFRGDSACHESGLVNWLRDPQRPDGPRGLIHFAVSARMSTELSQALKAVPEAQWQTIGREASGTLRQWAEVDFVPGEKVEKKDIQPLRYIGLRLLKPQGELFDDGNDRRHYAVLTNRDEAGDWLLDWHREKQGTIEHIHDELKNGLGAGRLPSAKFGANAAWFRIACIAHNILMAVRYAWPDEKLQTAKAKRLRLELIYVSGRFSRDRRKITLRLAAPARWIKQLLQLFSRFPLPTQPTG
jgi:hypothetical protein